MSRSFAHRKAAALATAALLASVPTMMHAQASGDWRSYGRDESHARNSPLTEITPENVGGLREAWTYHMRPAGTSGEAIAAPDSSGPRAGTGFAASEASPLVVDGVMYLSTPYHRVVALDAATGRERWAYTLPGNDQPSTRGVAYWPGSKGSGGRIIFGGRTGKLYSLNAATGALDAGFGTDGTVDMKTPEVMNGTKGMFGMSSPPAIYQNLIITGSRVQEMPVKGPSGDVRAWDARTGKLVWTFHTMPQPGEPNFGTWEGESWKQRSGLNVWTFVVVDEKRGIAYLPVAAPTYDRWGGDRKGANLYGNSIVAVNAKTGKYLWHFQTVHHDIWDVDIPVTTLIDVKRDGRTIPAVAVMNKMSIMFILDRVTGKPLYDVREVPVPTETDIPGEKPWPTQPMPAKPEPLTRLSWDASEIIDGPPEVRQRCEAMVKDFGIVPSRMFEPLKAGSAVNFFPGSLGGSDWGGGAFDPKTGLYVINLNQLASPQQMAVQPDGSYGMKRGYVYFMDFKTGLPCHKGKAGELVAVDVNTGTVAWRSTLGTNADPALKDIGVISAGGPITTASGLTFIGATRDSMMRAFATATGKELWSVKLPASNYGTPITYRAPGARQMIAVVATGGFTGEPTTSDAVVAYSLP